MRPTSKVEKRKNIFRSDDRRLFLTRGTAREDGSGESLRAFLLDQPTHTLVADDLREFGVVHERLPVEARATELARIKREFGYKDEDEVSLSSETPNLEAICAKFDKELFHALDEVRFVVECEGIFDVRNRSDH